MEETGLELLREAEERAAEIGVDGEFWYYVRVEFERGASTLDPGELLRRLGPELSLRAADGRLIIEGHAPLHCVSGPFDAARDALSDGADARVISVAVEPHDYELVEAPTLYFEA